MLWWLVYQHYYIEPTFFIRGTANLLGLSSGTWDHVKLDLCLVPCTQRSLTWCRPIWGTSGSRRTRPRRTRTRRPDPKMATAPDSSFGGKIQILKKKRTPWKVFKSPICFLSHCYFVVTKSFIGSSATGEDIVRTDKLTKSWSSA